MNRRGDSISPTLLGVLVMLAIFAVVWFAFIRPTKDLGEGATGFIKGQCNLLSSSTTARRCMSVCGNGWTSESIGADGMSLCASGACCAYEYQDGDVVIRLAGNTNGAFLLQPLQAANDRYAMRPLFGSAKADAYAARGIPRNVPFTVLYKPAQINGRYPAYCRASLNLAGQTSTSLGAPCAPRSGGNPEGFVELSAARSFDQIRPGGLASGSTDVQVLIYTGDTSANVNTQVRSFYKANFSSSLER